MYSQSDVAIEISDVDSITNNGTCRNFTFLDDFNIFYISDSTKGLSKRKTNEAIDVFLALKLIVKLNM